MHGGPSVIEKLLANKALIGICVPSYRARGKGISEIAGYYPRVISDDLFYAVQEIRLAPFGISNSSKKSYVDKSTSNSYEVRGLW